MHNGLPNGAPRQPEYRRFYGHLFYGKYADEYHDALCGSDCGVSSGRGGGPAAERNFGSAPGTSAFDPTGKGRTNRL